MVINKKCKNCGAVLSFDPSIQNLKCKTCSSEVDFKKSNDYAKHSIDMERVFEEIDNQESITTMHCSNCGAMFKGDKKTMSTTCSYCGANLVIDFENKTGIQPDACIPFAFDRIAASAKFNEGIKKKWFLPNKFKKSPPESSIESVYIPAFTFNCTTNNRYTGQLIEEYKDSDGDSQYSYRRISGNEVVYSKDLMVECSEYMTQTTFNTIKPFDTYDAYKFKEEFIMGYSVEYYNRKMEDVKNLVKKMIERNIKDQILKNYSYDRVDYLNIDTKYTFAEYSYIILPTYRVNYKYNNKEYSTFMNGQTGKVGGNLPRSGLKISAFIIGILLALGLIVYFIAFII